MHDNPLALPRRLSPVLRLTSSWTLAIALAACGGEAGEDAGPLEDAGTKTDAGVAATLASLALSPSSFSLEVGATLTLAATATYSDGSTALVDEGAVWASSDETVATVSAAGVVSAVGAGDVEISVTFEGESAASSGRINGSAVVDAGVPDDVATAEDAGTADDAGASQDAGAGEDAGVSGDAGSEMDAGLVDAGPVAADFVVFGDDYAAGVSFLPFGGSTNDVSIDTATFHEGSASLKVVVPASGYTGGAWVAATPRNLSAYNAVTFWARASADHALNAVGLGNDAAAGTYNAEVGGISLTSAWTQYIVPVPNPAELSSWNGLFHFAEGAEAASYTLWLDDVRYTTLDSSVLGAAMPAIATTTLRPEVGMTAQVPGQSVVFAVNGSNTVVSLAPAWLDYASSDAAVATVDAAGVITAVGSGTAEITASLDGVAATGVVTVVPAAPTSPQSAAPAPTHAAADVISLFSDAYMNVSVDTWSAVWDQADVEDVTLFGDAAKLYTNLVFAGIEFHNPGPAIDASQMTHFHIDVWNATSTVFKVKLVDFGGDGPGGGNDTEHELTFDAASTPALTMQGWQSFDIPLSDFAGLTSRSQLSQLILVGSSAKVYVDNLYFHK